MLEVAQLFPIQSCNNFILTQSRIFGARARLDTSYVDATLSAKLRFIQDSKTHPTTLGNPFAVGQDVFVQGWYRDPPAVKTTNLSNALKLTVRP